VSARRPTFEPTRPDWHYWLALTCLVAVVFYPALSADFLSWDDRTHLHQNPWLWPPQQRSVWQFWIEPFWGLYVPVSYSFWSLVANFATVVGHDGTPQLMPGPFHAANLGLHILAASLVYTVLRRCGHRQEAAGLGAALFAVHPLQVESVVWVSETRGLLAAIFAIAALDQYRRAIPFGPEPRRISPTGREFWTRYLCATGLFLLANLSKPSAVALPLMLIVLVATFDPQQWRRHARGLLPWFAIVVLIAGIMKFLQPAESIASTVSLAQRPWIVADSLSFYLSKLVIPWPLTIDYGRRPDVALTTSAITIAVIILAAVGVACMWLKPRRVWWTGLAIFAAGLAPVLGMIPFEFQSISTVADRYAYLALLGPAWIVAGVLSSGERTNPTARGIVLGLLAALAIVSAVQVRYWYNDHTLFQHALTINPRSVVALANLGYLHQQREEYDDATRYYRATLDVVPRDEIALKGLGEIAMARGEFTTALDRFRQATEAKPRDAGAWNNWGVAFGTQGEFVEAETRFRRAIELSQRPNAEFHVNLARALIEQKRLDDAHRELNRAVTIAPGLPSARELLRAIGK
jgi:Flp pilus assembly protein TadD